MRPLNLTARRCSNMVYCSVDCQTLHIVPPLGTATDQATLLRRQPFVILRSSVDEQDPAFAVHVINKRLICCRLLTIWLVDIP